MHYKPITQIVLFFCLSILCSCHHARTVDQKWIDGLNSSAGTDLSFRLLDQFSDRHELTSYSSKESLFLTYVDVQCATVNFQSLVSRLPKNNNSVSLLIYGGSKNSSRIPKGIQVPVLFDDFHSLVDRLNLRQTGEFVEISIKNGKIVNKGKLLGLPAVSCSPRQDRVPPRFDEVKEVFAKQCIKCHMQNENLDFFKTISSVRKWAKMSQSTLETFRMPPGGFDSQLDRKLQGFLSRERLMLLYDWFYFNAPSESGDQRLLDDARKQLLIEEQMHKLNAVKPDFVLKESRVYDVSIKGEDHGIYTYLSGPTDRNLYLKAARFDHNSQVLHHSVIYNTSNQVSEMVSRLPSEMFLANQNSNRDIVVEVNDQAQKGTVLETSLLFGYSNNYEDRYDSLNDGTAVFVPKGTYLTLNNHFQSIGTAEKNQSIISLYEYKGSNPEIVKRKFLFVDNFVIQPNQSDFQIKSIFPVSKKIKIYSIRAHLHMRGKSVKVLLKNKKTEELIFSIPFYLYKHNKFVKFEKPVIAEVGSELHFNVKYDNSMQNIGNPNPNQSVSTGLSILNNEMYLMIITYSDVN